MFGSKNSVISHLVLKIARINIWQDLTSTILIFFSKNEKKKQYNEIGEKCRSAYMEENFEKSVMESKY